MLTIIGARVTPVWSFQSWRQCAEVSPDWSPIRHYGGYHQADSTVEAPERVAFSAIDSSSSRSAPLGSGRERYLGAGMRLLRILRGRV